MTREFQGSSTKAPKENQILYQNTNNDKSVQNDRSAKPYRERVQVLYENEPRFPPNQSQSQYDPQQRDMIPMQEQPRVVVRSIRDDRYQPPYHQSHEEPSSTFVPIPVQVERGGPQQRFGTPPYHSDPYYRHTNP